MIQRIDRPRVLLVEDDATFRKSLALLVAGAGCDVSEAANLAEARAQLEARAPDLVVLDLELPDGNGLELKLSASIAPDTPFLVVSGSEDADARTAALRSGAAEFLRKPVDPAQLEAVLHAVRAGEPLRAEMADLRATLREAGRFGPLVGRSDAMQHVYDLIGRVARTAVPVLVLGESGTGKELVAQAVHGMSPRRGEPFVEVNCGAIPETLIESRLFGHEKGAFTGADARHQGVFEQADGGTLFLDEIGEMPAELQVRLLRVLETSTFTRVGGATTIRVDVRIVAATNRDPREAIADGRLREDLFHRLNVFPIEVPPLRDRRDDVELLARHFLDAVNAEQGTTKRLAPAAIEWLESAAWTGNVRELKNVIHRAWILADDVIQAANVAPGRAGGAAGTAPVHRDAGALAVEVGMTMADAERALITATLEACGGNKKQTAEMLGISVRTLYSRLRAYGDAAPPSTESGAHGAPLD